EIQQDLGNAVEAGPHRLHGTGSYRECAWIRSARLKPGMLEKEGFAALVLRLRAEGISDLVLLTAVEQTPRSLFVPPMLSEEAYSSRTVPIDCGSFMEVADLAVRLLHWLHVKPVQRVLVVGICSGSTAAILVRQATYASHTALSNLYD